MTHNAKGAGTSTPTNNPPKTDTITAARWLRRYWHARGWDIDLEIVNLTPGEPEPTWSIRSNLVNGYPKDYFDKSTHGVKGPRGPTAPLASKV